MGYFSDVVCPHSSVTFANSAEFPQVFPSFPDGVLSSRADLGDTTTPAISSIEGNRYPPRKFHIWRSCRIAGAAMDSRGGTFGRRNVTRLIIHTAMAFAGRSDGPPVGRTCHGVCRLRAGAVGPSAKICYVLAQSYCAAVNGGINASTNCLAVAASSQSPFLFDHMPLASM